MFSVRVKNQLKREFSLNVDREECWMLNRQSSSIGLHQEWNQEVKIFVANRAQFIQDNIKKDQWKYIPTKHNPAALALSGIAADSADKFHVWNYGSDLPWTDESKWNKYDIDCNIQKDDF